MIDLRVLPRDMRSLVLPLVVITLSAASCIPALAKPAGLSLENKTYTDARKIIVSQYHWNSIEDVKYCSSNHPRDSCKSTPELYWCKFAANCEISFYKNNKCLFLSVRGGPRWASYKVSRVRFANGVENCPEKYE